MEYNYWLHPPPLSLPPSLLPQRAPLSLTLSPLSWSTAAGEDRIGNRNHHRALWCKKKYTRLFFFPPLLTTEKGVWWNGLPSAPSTPLAVNDGKNRGYFFSLKTCWLCNASELTQTPVSAKKVFSDAQCKALQCIIWSCSHWVFNYWLSWDIGILLIYRPDWGLGKVRILYASARTPLDAINPMPSNEEGRLTQLSECWQHTYKLAHMIRGVVKFQVQFL